MLLFFLTGLSFEIKRIIIAFWAFVKREIENILRKFWGGERRIATGAVRPRNDIVFTRGAVRRRGEGTPPYGGYKRCGKTGRCRHRPLRKRNKRCNGRATARVAPTDNMRICTSPGRRPRRPVLPNALLRFVGRRALTPSFAAAGPPGRGAFGPGLWGYSPRRFLWTDPGGTG